MPCWDLTHLPLVLHIYASVNWVSVGSGNGLSPIRRQAITWTNTGLLSTPGNKFQWNLNRHYSTCNEKIHLEMLSAIMAAILSREDK